MTPVLELRGYALFRLTHSDIDGDTWEKIVDDVRTMTAYESLLRRLVIAWDADQTEEFYTLLKKARKVLGLTLASDAEAVLEQLQTAHAEEPE